MTRMTMRRFWAGAVMDPVTLDASSSRLIAFLLCGAVYLAIALGRDAATISVLVVGGIGSLLARKTSTVAPPADPSPPE